MILLCDDDTDTLLMDHVTVSTYVSGSLLPTFTVTLLDKPRLRTLAPPPQLMVRPTLLSPPTHLIQCVVKVKADTS